MTTTDRVRWTVVGIVAVAGGLRLGWGLAALNDVPDTWMGAGDQYSYWYYGNEIADGHGYISYLTGEVSSYYPLGYPAMLATVFWLQEHTPLPNHQPTAVAVLHAALSTASVFFVWLIGRAALGTKAGLVAAGVAALYPNLILNVANYTLETAFIFWMLAALAVIVTHDWSAGLPSSRRLLAFGTVLGCSVIVRPFSAPLVVGLAVALVVAGAGWKRVAASLAIVAVPMALILTPWTIRNAVRMHAFVPISTNLGDTACLDRSMDADGGFRWAAHEGCADPALAEAERSRKSLGKAISFVTHHPAKELELIGKRFGRMLEHDHSGLLETESVSEPVLGDGARSFTVALADWWFWLTMAASAPGLVALLRGGAARSERLIVAVAFIGLLLIPSLLWGNVRFHIPALPVAAIGAAAAPLALHRRATLA